MQLHLHPDVFSVLFAIIYCPQSQGQFEKSYLLLSENKAYEGKFEKRHLVVQCPGVYLATDIQYHSLSPSMCPLNFVILQVYYCLVCTYPGESL